MRSPRLDQALRLYSEPKTVFMSAAADGSRFRSTFKAGKVAIKIKRIDDTCVALSP